ncbi:major facilitator superfamily domain-containing protein [Infundibulicybe gibba]|nr:major facilitator superfamily domain-containing protein [Infundibulicybe gibba]
MERENKLEVSEKVDVASKRGSRFWLVFVANLVVDLLSALDLTAVSTALPTIVDHLNGSDSFGKPILLAFIGCFALGMNMLIAGRVVQGLGGGGCIAVTEIIYADLSLTSTPYAIGPPIGGSLASSGAWSGLGLIIASTTSISIALNWAGVQHAWNSAPVLVPLCLGAAGLIAFFVVEFTYAKSPTVPPFIVTNRTTLSGYIATFIHGIVSMAVIFYLPTYFQASQLASPIRSGVDFFGLATVVPPAAILTGLSVQLLDRYRPQNYLGWILTIATYVGLQILLAFGLGIVWIGTQFPILAPLPFSNNAHALAFFTFLRHTDVGTVFGGAILQNQLRTRLPAEFVARFGSNTQLVYAVIPQIRTLPVELQTQVRRVFADAIRIIWFVMMGIAVLGLASCFLMEEVKMRKALDETWGLTEKPARADQETQGE